MVATSNDTVSSAVISNADGVTGEKPLFFFLERYMQSFRDEMLQFVEAVLEDKATPTTGEDGLNLPLLVASCGERNQSQRADPFSSSR